MREPIGIEFDLYFLRAVGHTEKAYIMDGFSATAIHCERAVFMKIFEWFILNSRRI